MINEKINTKPKYKIGDIVVFEYQGVQRQGVIESAYGSRWGKDYHRWYYSLGVKYNTYFYEGDILYKL